MIIKQAGVLVMVEKQSQSLILTKRSKQMPVHAGEVSFPGGQMQGGDKNTEATALRETQEEIGIDPKQVHIIQPMGKVFTLTGYEITPYFAEVKHIMEYHLQEEEVDKLIRLPMHQVRQKQLYQPITKQFEGTTIKTLHFYHPEYSIWGATAKIMLQLVDLVP